MWEEAKPREPTQTTFKLHKEKSPPEPEASYHLPGNITSLWHKATIADLRPYASGNVHGREETGAFPPALMIRDGISFEPLTSS